jgi:hypothetical protein
VDYVGASLPQPRDNRALEFEYKTAAFIWTKADAGQLSMFGDDVELARLDPQMGMGRWTR